MGESTDQLTDRLLKLAGLLGLLLIAVVVNFLLHGGGSTLNPVAQAAERTASLPGSRIALEVRYSAPSLAAPIVGIGAGSFDSKSGRSKMELSIPIPGHGTETIRAVGDTRTVYVRSPRISAELPPGRTWLALQPLLGHSLETAFGSSGSAKSALDMLAATGSDVEQEEDQLVRGQLTTRYQATIHLDRVSEALAKKGDLELSHEYQQLADRLPATIPVEVWIDERGVARRIDTVEEINLSDPGETVTMETRMELFDFGKQPTIDLPADDEAVDMTPLIRAELRMLDGSGFRKLLAPSVGRPLSAAAFRRKGNAICRDLIHKAHETGPPMVSLGDRLREAKTKSAFLAVMRDWSQTYVRPGIALAVDATRRLAQLTPPPSDNSEYTTVKRYLAIGLERLQALAVALETGSLRALKTLAAEEKAHKHDGDPQLRRLGLNACIGDSADKDGQPA